MIFSNRSLWLAKVWIENAGPRIYRALKAAVFLALFCFLALLCLISFTVYRGLFADGHNQVGYTFENLNRGVLELNLAAKELRQTSKNLNDDSQQQLNDANAAVEATRAAAAALSTLVTHTDASLNEKNSGVLPALTAAIGVQSSGIADIEAKAGASIDELQSETRALDPILKNAAEVTANAAKLSADPDLADLVHQAAIAGARLADASASVASATASFDRDMRRIEPVVTKATTPASLTARVVTFIIDAAAKAGSMLAGFAK